MINSQEIKIGTCIRMDGKIWTCIDFQHRKPGKGNTVVCWSVPSRLASSWRMCAWSVAPGSTSTRTPRA